MQIGKAFTYTFEDSKWLSKLLIGALISIVPILNLAWGGYTTEIIRRVSQQHPEPLADWDDLGRKFVDGLILFVAGILYGLPLIVLIALMVPFFVGAASAEGDIQDVLTAVSTGAGILFSCLAVLYGLFLSIIFPAVQVNFARKGSFGSCFEVGNIVRLATSNLGDFLLAWLAYLVFSVIAGSVGSILISILAVIPCVGWVLMLVVGALITPLIGVVYAHLFGQVGASRAIQVAA